MLGQRLVDALTSGASAWLNYSSKLESTKIAFTTMLGSVDLATEHLAELQTFALKTPFEFEGLIDASQTMQALGFNASQVIPILEDVGNAVAGAGGGKERLDRVVLALAQIQSKGKVATQEINQLAESGISGWKILEAQLGKSRAELTKMVESGQISSAVFLEAFQKFSKQNFGGLMEAQSKTFAGAMSNIKDALLQTSATAFAPLYQKLSETALALGDMANNSKKFKDDMESLGKVMVTVWEGAGTLIYAARDAVGIVSALATQQFAIMTHGAMAFARGLQSVLYNMEAFARLAVGDFYGAAIAMIKSNQQAALAVGEMKEAVEASGIAIRAAGQMWTDLSDRATRAAMKTVEAGVMINAAAANLLGANVGQSALGAGIFRQKAAPTSLGTSTSKGTDPAVAQQRMEELRLKATLARLDEEDRARERSLEKRKKQFEVFMFELGVSEESRHLIIKNSLESEKKAAEALRDPQQRNIQLLEIANKITEENNRHQKANEDMADRRAKVLDETNDFIKDQNEAMAESVVRTDRWTAAVNAHIKSLAKQGVALRYEQELMLRMSALDKVVAENRERAIEAMADPSNMRIPSGLDQIFGDIEAQRDALADAINQGMGGELPPVMMDLSSFYDQMRQLGRDLTNTIDDSIRTGFERGIGAGVLTFFQGILEMINSAALNALEKRLADVFSGLGGGSAGGGGSWWQKLLGIVVGGIAGGVGGSLTGGGTPGGTDIGRSVNLPGFSGFGRRAKGGDVSAWKPYMVGEKGPEMVIPNRNSYVVPNNQLAAMNGGEAKNYHLHLTQLIQAPSGRVAPESAEQAAAKAMSAMASFSAKRGGNF